MKKLNLFLSAVLIMAGSAMFAQTQFFTSNPFYDLSDQWPSAVVEVPAPEMSPCVDCSIDQIARVFYTPFDTENMSLINQTGDRNDANVYQTGAVNYSVINQDGLNGLVEGFDNEAQVYQDGSENYSDVGQHGEFNRGDVIQIGRKNYAKQLVGDGMAENNDAYVRQEGGGNASSQTQYYDGNIARIEQLTDKNEATQYQTGEDTHAAGSGNYASILQWGANGNKALQVQTGTSNNAEAEQDGLLNVSKSTQIGNSNASNNGNSNFARSLQIGDRNLACVDQKAGSVGLNGSWIYQLGNSNKAGATQDTNAIGWGNLSYISQYGDSNIASVTQFNGLSGH